MIRSHGHDSVIAGGPASLRVRAEMCPDCSFRQPEGRRAALRAALRRCREDDEHIHCPHRGQDQGGPVCCRGFYLADPCRTPAMREATQTGAVVWVDAAGAPVAETAALDFARHMRLAIRTPRPMAGETRTSWGEAASPAAAMAMGALAEPNPLPPPLLALPPLPPYPGPSKTPHLEPAAAADGPLRRDPTPPSPVAAGPGSPAPTITGGEAPRYGSRRAAVEAVLVLLEAVCWPVTLYAQGPQATGTKLSLAGVRQSQENPFQLLIADYRRALAAEDGQLAAAAHSTAQRLCTYGVADYHALWPADHPLTPVVTAIAAATLCVDDALCTLFRLTGVAWGSVGEAVQNAQAFLGQAHGLLGPLIGAGLDLAVVEADDAARESDRPF